MIFASMYMQFLVNWREDNIMKLHKDKKLLLFDLDGTLIDSVPDISLAVNAMLHELHIQVPVTEDMVRGWVGNGARKLVERVLRFVNTYDDGVINDCEIDNALQIFFRHYLAVNMTKTVCYKGVDKGLRKLKESGYILALITNKPLQFVPKILKYFAWSDTHNELFSMLLGGDSLAHKKPHPLPLQHVCKELGFTENQAFMIGDSKNDIFAGQNAGIDTIGLSYGYNYGQHISDFNPTHYFDNFNDMVNFLTRA